MVDGILSVVFDVATATELLAAAAKGGLLIPAISSSLPVSVAMKTRGAVQFLQVYSLYFAYNLKTVQNTQAFVANMCFFSLWKAQ